jgi:hypothetical protein
MNFNPWGVYAPYGVMHSFLKSTVMNKYVNFTGHSVSEYVSPNVHIYDESIERAYSLEPSLEDGKSVEDVADYVSMEIVVKAGAVRNVILDLPAWLLSFVERNLAKSEQIQSVHLIVGRHLIRSTMFDIFVEQHQFEEMLKARLGNVSTVQLNIELQDADANQLVKLVQQYEAELNQWRSAEPDEYNEPYELRGESLAQYGSRLRSCLLASGLQTLATSDLFN